MRTRVAADRGHLECPARLPSASASTASHSRRARRPAQQGSATRGGEPWACVAGRRWHSQPPHPTHTGRGATDRSASRSGKQGWAGLRHTHHAGGPQLWLCRQRRQQRAPGASDSHFRYSPACPSDAATGLPADDTHTGADTETGTGARANSAGNARAAAHHARATADVYAAAAEGLLTTAHAAPGLTVTSASHVGTAGERSTPERTPRTPLTGSDFCGSERRGCASRRFCFSGIRFYFSGSMRARKTAAMCGRSAASARTPTSRPAPEMASAIAPAL